VKVICFASWDRLSEAFFSAHFLLAGVSALIVLISHADKTNDIIFGNEGALKGLDETSLHNILYNYQSLG
jgi:hypothetical protein